MLNRAAFRIALGLTLAACSSGDSSPAPKEPDGPGILIVTTNQIRSGSHSLERFVEEKKSRNYRVRVATESDFGGAGERGQERALRIRSFLQQVASDYRYLLLIGDGHPVYGDVPMMRVWPRHQMPADSCGGYFSVDCRSCDTDLMYADLTGNWDLNGNGRYGEHELDDGPGGIDFHAELVVGRMPVFFGDGAEADRILEHAISYMNEPEAERAWRRNVLLPAAWYYFKGQRMQSATVPQNMDGAANAEWISANVLSKHAGVKVTRMYETEGIVPSAFQSDVSLTEDNLIDTWNQGQGIVFWHGHGLSREVGRVVWMNDDNHNGGADAEELATPLFIRSSGTERLNGKHPGFVIASSCEVGSADIPYDLAQALLLNGGAVGMIGSTNVTPGDGTMYENPQAELDMTRFSATNAGALVVDAMFAGRPAAEAFAETMEKLGTNGESESHAGRMMLVYFGDPTLGLED